VPGLIDSVEASGGALVAPAPAELGKALENFFAGSLQLAPRVSTVPWTEVAQAMEERLTEVVERSRRGGRVALE
jgi:hypothetical protein